MKNLVTELREKAVLYSGEFRLLLEAAADRIELLEIKVQKEINNQSK